MADCAERRTGATADEHIRHSLGPEEGQVAGCCSRNVGAAAERGGGREFSTLFQMSAHGIYCVEDEVGDGSGAVGTQPFAHVLLVTNATYAQNFVLPPANNVRNGSEKLRSTGCECRPLETNVKHDIVAANKKQ